MSRRSCLLVAAAVLVTASPAHGTTFRDHFLADQSEATIANAVEPLLRTALASADAARHEGLYLLHQTALDITSARVETISSAVILVRSDSDVPTTMLFESPSGSEVKKVAAWWARPAADGRMQPKRLDSSTTRVLRAKGVTTVVFGFPSLQPGDVVGFSVHQQDDGLLQHWNADLSAPLPTQVAEFWLRHDEDVLYSVKPLLVAEGAAVHDVHRAEEGEGVVHSLRLIDVAAAPSGPFAPPSLLVAPHVSITLESVRLGDAAPAVAWTRVEYWSTLALYLAALEESAIERSLELQVRARQLAGGRPTLTMVAPDLCRFVRDEIQVIPAGKLLERDSTDLASLATQKLATPGEQALLLLALTRTFTKRAHLAWVRLRDRSLPQYDAPSLGQFDLALVRVEDGARVYWFDPACKLCAPGEVRAEARGGRAFVVDLDVEQAMFKLHEDLYAEILTPFERVRRLNELLSRAKWWRWEQVPGSAVDTASIVQETVHWNADLSQGELQLRMAGDVGLRSLYRDSGDPQAVVQAHLKESRPEATAGPCKLLSAEHDEQLRIGAVIIAEPASGADGGAWLLPAGRVYGRPCVPQWDGAATQSYYLPARVAMVRRSTFPLHADSSTIQLPADFTVTSAGVDYRARCWIEAGRIAMEQSLSLPGGLFRDPQTLASIAAALQQVREFETTPVLVATAAR